MKSITFKGFKHACYKNQVENDYKYSIITVSLKYITVLYYCYIPVLMNS